MQFIVRRRLDEAAREDAAAEISESLMDRITAQLGPRPESFNPTKHPLHAQMVRALNNQAEIADATDDLRRLERERANHDGTVRILAGLIFTFCLEATGGYLVFKSMARPLVEQVMLGAGLALFLFLLTSAAVHPEGDSATTTTPSTTGRRLLGLVTRGIYLVFVLALAIVRLREADEELGEAQQLAECCVMLACSVGPGFLLHHFNQRYQPIRRLNDELALCRRRLSELTKKRRRAEQFVAQLSSRQLAYDEEVERLAAIYRTRHRLVSRDVRQSLTAPNTEPQGEHDEEA